MKIRRREKMNKVTKSLIWCTILAVIVASGISPVAAVPAAIDGNLQDWGLSNLVTQPWSNDATWLPSPGINFIVENDKNPAYGETPIGVHIRGTSTSYVPYDEPKVLLHDGQWAIQPVGGERFDLEAIYLDQDPTNMYLAIVSSVDPTETYGLRPGDLALNIDADPTTGHLGYEYGIVTGTNPYPASLNLKQGDVVYLPEWSNTGAVSVEGGTGVITGFLPGGYVVGNLGTGFAYNNNWMSVNDNDRPNWVIEAAIPKALIGSPQTVSLSNIFMGDNCINDYFYIPEFPTMAVSVGAIFGLIFVISRIREGKKKE